jgi:type IV secretory pathway VirB4 component
VAAGLPASGPLLGHDRLAGGGFYFDLIDAYRAGLVQGPNMVISGAGAHGKSSIAKTMIYRGIAVAGTRRFIAVIDPKGEWLPLADALGWTALRIAPGGAVRVNPFDPGPAATRLPHADQVDRRVSVATTLLAIVLGEAELSASQRRLVAAAVHRISADPYRVPTLSDLRDMLAHPDDMLADTLDTTLEELLERRRPVLDACVNLIEHDLRGIADGPSTITLDWDESPGLVLDLSALLTHRRSLKLVLTAVSGWLSGAMYSQSDRQKINIIDEGWVALDDLSIVRYLQDQWRLGRQFGCGNILITHALADLTSQVDAGKAQASIAAGMLNTTSVRVFLHQNPENIDRLFNEMGLSRTEANLLARLRPFQALWKIGEHTAFVDHVIAPWEWSIADTDRAMRVSPTNPSGPSTGEREHDGTPS